MAHFVDVYLFKVFCAFQLYCYHFCSEVKIVKRDLVCFYSAKQSAAGDKSPQSNFVRVHSDGTCLWWPLFEQSVSHCPIDVTWFPFDYQHCNLSFESWKYNSEMLNISAKELPEQLSHYHSNEEWKLLGKQYLRRCLFYRNIWPINWCAKVFSTLLY